MCAIHRFLAALAILAATQTAWAISLPLDLDLAAPTATINRMSLTVDLKPTRDSGTRARPTRATPRGNAPRRSSCCSIP